jgi:hypothetical protein
MASILNNFKQIQHVELVNVTFKAVYHLSVDHDLTLQNVFFLAVMEQ